MFFHLVLATWVVLTLYVGWRAGSVPWLARRVPRWLLMGTVALLGVSYIVARVVRQAGWPLAATVLEVLGANWIGVLFLLFVALLAADLITGCGFLAPRRAPAVRGWALVAGMMLAAIALVQGLRAPVVRDYEIAMPGLPAERDGTTIVFISDLHLGTLLGEGWLAARVAQVSALRPDAIVIGGDVLEGDDESERALLPLFRRLSAPFGVWAVPGNHERHGGGTTSNALEADGIRVLRNEWREVAPGLVLAGVEAPPRDDHSNSAASALDAAMKGRPAGAATIFVSHAPVQVQRAARAGARLMLSAHTHDGQIWPFRYLVGLEFPYMAGRYDVAGMPLLVCRGTGTFGPRMRLWYPSEILRITLRSPATHRLSLRTGA